MPVVIGANSGNDVTASGNVFLTTSPFFVNCRTVASNYTLAGTNNAVSAGKITINNGITVTISSGGRWVIV